MRTKKSIGGIIFDSLNVLFMCAMIIVTLYPMLYVLFASLSDSVLFVAHRGLLLKPVGFCIDSYRLVLSYPMILRGYANTIFITVVGTILNLLATVAFAYFLSNKDIMLRKLATKFVLLTGYFSGGLIPIYMVIKGVGLLDTLWVLIIPGLIAFTNVVIMRTAFDGVPASLSEAAFIDGATDFHVLFKVLVPVTIPTISVLALYYGVGHWNQWFSASIYIKERNLFPLSLILREILYNSNMQSMGAGGAGATTGDVPQLAETVKYATVIVATVPILCIYPFLQKYFVGGVMVGAVKG